MPQLATIIALLSEELLNLDEGRAKYQDGDEVTRKDGRVFKKMSGKWIYQRKSAGGPTKDKPSAPDQPPGGEPPPKPKFKRKVDSPEEAKLKKDLKTLDDAFSRVAGKRRSAPEGSIRQRLQDFNDMSHEEAEKVIQSMVDAGKYKREILISMPGLQRYALVRVSAAARKKDDEGREQKKKDEEEARLKKEKEDQEEKARDEKRKAAREKFHGTFHEHFDKLSKSNNGSVNAADLRHAVMEATGMELPDYVHHYAQMIAPGGGYEERTWKNLAGFWKVSVFKTKPTTAAPPTPKTPPDKPKIPAPPPGQPPTSGSPPQPTPPPPKAAPPPPPPPTKEQPKAPPTKEEPKPQKSWKEQRKEIAERNPVPKFNSGKEASAWAASKHPHVQWDLGKVHPELAHTAVQVVHHLSQEWPEVMGKLKYMGTAYDFTRKRIEPTRPGGKARMRGLLRGSRWNPYTYAHAEETTGQLGLNPAHFTDHEGMKKSMKRDVDSGFHPKGCEDPHAIVTHEFGHHVDYSIRRLTDHFMFPGVAVSTADIHNMFRRQVRATNDLSTYAMKNEAEGWAEGFSSRQHGDPELWPEYTKKMHEWIGAYQARRGSAKNGEEHRKAMAAMKPEEKEAAKAEFKAFLNKVGLKLAGYN